MVLYGKVASEEVLHNTIGDLKTKVHGLGWPIGKLSNEPLFNKASGRHLVKAQMMQLLRTRKGERVMLPEFGLDLERYLFNPLTSDRAAEITQDIQRAMAVYASNIVLLSARVVGDDNIKGYGMPGLLISLTVMSSLHAQPIDVEITI